MILAPHRIATCCILGVALAAASPAGTLTVTEGTQFSASLSPDGQRLVIDLQGQLWTLPAGGGTAQAVTDGLGDDRLPRFSPDGAWIAFQSFRGGSWDIWLARPDGSGARTVAAGPADEREPAWSGDGRRLVFASDRAGSYDIWSVDIAAGDPQRLTSEPSDEYAPALSADGALAYVSDREGKPALWLQPPDGVPRRLTGGGRVGAPAFSPDGTSLAVVAAREEIGFPGMARQQLIVMALGPDTAQAVSAPDEDVFAFAPSWTASGRLLYTADGHLRSREAAGGGAREIPFSAGFTLQSRRSRPRLAAALRGEQPVLGITEPVAVPGRGVAFAALGDLWLRADDGTIERLTADAWVERDPAPSPDGRWLAFISDRGGGMQVWLRDMATGAERVLTRVAGGVRYPVFSPDGRTIAFQQPGPRGDQDFTVRLVDVQSGALRSLKTPPLWPARMAFSADGQRLLLTVLTAASRRSREGVNRLFWVAVADGALQELVLPGTVAPDTGVAVSPDGGSLALVSEGALAVARLSPGGESVQALREVHAALTEYPGWRSDGRLLFLSDDGLREMDIDRGKAQRLRLALGWSPRSGEGRRLVHAGRLFDGSGERYRENVDILIEDGRIRTVQPHRAHPPGVPVVDAAGQAVLPGLMDNHAHHQAHDGEWVGRAWLAFGVTGVVEPGGLPYESRELQESWDSGARPGPRLFTAGPQLDGQRRYFPFAAHVTSARRLDRELRRARALDYALLKTYTRMTPARQIEVIRRAHALGRIASSHEIYPALARGGDRVEHLRGTSRAGFSSKQSDLLRSYADVIGIVGQSGAVISPTLVVSGGFFDYWLEHPELAGNRQFVALYPETYRRGLAGFANLVGRRAALLGEGAANARRAVLELRRAGARVVAGTDSPIFPYGLALHVELAGYVEAGLTPAEALRSATSDAADALGLGGQLGRIEPGSLADLVIIDGDPLRDITQLSNIAAVLRGGRYFTLDELLRPPG